MRRIILTIVIVLFTVGILRASEPLNFSNETISKEIEMWDIAYEKWYDDFDSSHLQEYTEWAFVNLHKYIWCCFSNGMVGGKNVYEITGHYGLRDFGHTYEELYKIWMPKDKSIEELERKWKGKPKPEGFDEFLEYNKMRELRIKLW